jgi:uncharacterized membrane protein
VSVLPPEKKKIHESDGKVFDRFLRLSDGVFAITLLVLSVIPDGADDLSTELVALVPEFFDFWVTVFIVAIYWREHLVVFDSLRGIDGVILTLNFVYLGLVALIPLPNRLLSLFDDPLTYVVFAALLLLLVVVEACMLAYARWKGLLTEHGVSAFRSDILRAVCRCLVLRGEHAARVHLRTFDSCRLAAACSCQHSCVAVNKCCRKERMHGPVLRTIIHLRRL